VLLALVPGGLARVLRDAALFVSGSTSPSSPATVAVFTILIIVVNELAGLPVRVYQTFILERRYGLSAVPLNVWVVDHVKALAMSAVLAVGASEVIYATLVRWPRWWWAASTVAAVAAVIVLARVTPVLLLPVFYKFKPLDRQALRSRLESLCDRVGVPVLGVYEWGLGEKTTRANAALVGTGRSRRILLSDTLLAEYTEDEIEVILAHELGHHRYRDIRRGLTFEAILITVSFAAAAATLHAFWRPLQLSSPADVAGLPLLMLVAGAISLLARPALNAMSRRSEHRADRFALELTERPDAFVSAMRRLAAQNLAEPRPSAATLWLFHTHPPFEQRIQAARAFLS
jgi:STE24 endopeptidase